MSKLLEEVSIIGAIKGDTGSLDYGSYGCLGVRT